MSDEIRIVIAEDHPFFRDGVRTALEGAPGFSVIGEATDGAAALELIRSLQPDIAILDIGLPVLNGVALVRRLRELRLPVEVVFLTVYDDRDMFDEALDLGVKGYLLKDCTTHELLKCLAAVAAGQHYTAPPMTSHLVSKTQRIERFTEKVPGLSQLTAHERSILRRIGQGQTSKEIAKAIGITPKTVDAHRSNICAKLKLQGTHGLSRFAMLHRSDL